jgi:teichuronic acid biosynthesis glycosyltransferase TuaH
MKRPVIICANPVFGDKGLSSTEEIAKELSKLRPVVFVNFPLTLSQLRSEKPRLKRVNTVVEVPGYDQLWVYEPPIMLPSNALNGLPYAVVNDINNKRYFRGVQRLINQFNWNDIDLVNAFNPQFAGACSKLKAHSLTYYCYDNIAASHWMRNHGSRLEDQLIHQADKIIVSSPGLKEKFSQSTVPVDLVPNGMDASNFKLLNDLPKDSITLAYVGAIDDRIDYDFVNKLLQLPIVSKLRLVGPLKTAEAEGLVNHSKVEYLGIVPKEVVGELLKDVNTGLIPFIRNEFTKYIYPLKINEYLGKGLAVLTTDFADLADFNQFVRPVGSFAEATDELQRILKEDLTEPKKLARHQFALQNTWEQRAQSFNEALNG